MCGLVGYVGYNQAYPILNVVNTECMDSTGVALAAKAGCRNIHN